MEAGLDIGNTRSPVTPVYLKGSITQAANLVRDLRENHDIFCSMVVYPVVPQGIIILRLIPMANHSAEEVSETIAIFKNINARLSAGFYDLEQKAPENLPIKLAVQYP